MSPAAVLPGNVPRLIDEWQDVTSTEGIFLLYLITSVIVESVRNNRLTYSWIEIILMVFTVGSIRQYYKRHKQIYLMVFDNMKYRLERYMATPAYFDNKNIQKLARQAIQARNEGHLPGFTVFVQHGLQPLRPAVTKDCRGCWKQGSLLGHVRIGLHRDLCDSNDWNYGQRLIVNRTASLLRRLFCLIRRALFNYKPP